MRVTVERLEIPLTMSVTQASSSRATTSALWARAERAGRVGLGEGCPRPYVTGETLQGAYEWCLSMVDSLGDIASVADLTTFADLHRRGIDANPAAWCTLELALLDLLAREAGCFVEALLGIDTTLTTLSYSAVVDDSSDQQFETLAALYSSMGLTDMKLKARGDTVHDQRRVRRLQDAGAAAIRLDANNLWGSEVADALAALSSVDGWWAVEEPLTAGLADELSELATALGCSVILDECLQRPTDVDRFASLPGSWVANVKVSKSGGLMRSMAIIERARSVGWPIIIGAQVGETSVLTRAGIAAARAAGDRLEAIEGGFGTMLLSADPAAPTVMWGHGGVLDITSVGLGSFGWGLTESRLM